MLFILDGVHENTKSFCDCQYLVFWESYMHWCNEVTLACIYLIYYSFCVSVYKKQSGSAISFRWLIFDYM